jgi:hypothetical protein
MTNEPKKRNDKLAVTLTDQAYALINSAPIALNDYQEAWTNWLKRNPNDGQAKLSPYHKNMLSRKQGSERLSGVGWAAKSIQSQILS